MNGVLGYAELLSDTSLSPEQLGYVSTIQSSGRHLLSLINDVLDLSKQQSGKWRIEFLPIDMQHIIEQSCELSCQTFGRVQLVVRWKPSVLSSHRMKVLGDATRIRQVFCNLLSNACKFSPHGGMVELLMDVSEPVDSVTWEELKRMNTLAPEYRDSLANSDMFQQAQAALDEPDMIRFLRWEFTIRDQGIGIAKEQQSRLFQSFSQMETSTNRLFGGTGLGLAIGEQLVRIMEGWKRTAASASHIHVASLPGRGSSFTFSVLTPWTGPGSALKLPAYATSTIVSDSPIIPCISQYEGEQMPLLPGQALSPASETDLQRQQTRVLLAIAHEPTRTTWQGVLRSWNIVTIDHDGSDDHDGAPILCAICDPFVSPVADFSTAPITCFFISQMQQRGIPVIYCDFQRAGNLSESDHFLNKPLMLSKLRATLRAVRKHAAAPSNLLTAKRQIIPPLTPSPSLTPRPLRVNPKILLVEDNNVNRKLVLKLLSVLGYSDVHVACDGQEATHTAVTNSVHYDLILMDVMMPNKDGLTATREILDSYQTVDGRKGMNPPFIIALTASAMVEERSACTRAGMCAFLSKPLAKEVLSETLELWVGRLNIAAGTRQNQFAHRLRQSLNSK